MALWQGKKTMRVTKFHGEIFLRVVIIVIWTGWTLAVAVHCYDDSTINIVVAITITITINLQPAKVYTTCLRRFLISAVPVGVQASTRHLRRCLRRHRPSCHASGTNGPPTSPPMRPLLLSSFHTVHNVIIIFIFRKKSTPPNQYSTFEGCQRSIKLTDWRPPVWTSHIIQWKQHEKIDSGWLSLLT